MNNLEIACCVHLLTRSHLLVVTSHRTLKTNTWFEEHLTGDNQEFMRKSLAEEYRKQTVDKLNPIKDEPWLRHQWTEGRPNVTSV